MKKTLVLFLAAFLAISICACTNGGNESSMLPSSEPPVSSESSVPQTLSFDGMDFTFTVPSRWSKDDYTVKVVKDDVMSSQDIEYSHVDFLFKGNADTPLLSIWAAPKAWWDDQSAIGAELPSLLQETSNTVYLADIPTENPVTDEETAALYDKMAITLEEVKEGFTVVNPSSSSVEPTYVDGVLQDGTMNTITIQTAHGKELLFHKEGAEVNEPDGLIIGDMLRVYYDGTIHGTDTEGVTVTKIEKIS